MDPKHLYYLAEIVRYGSMSRASERLGVVQPTLTRVVKLLEDQAGAPLLTRGRYGVVPTDLGERLADAGNGIVHQIDKATEAVDQWKSGIGVELRVGVGPMLAVSVMPRLLEAFLDGKWPYNLKLITATVGELLTRLNQGELDVVLAPARMNLHQEKLHQHVVLNDKMAIYAGKKSALLGRAKKVTAADLATQPWIAVGALSNIHEVQTEIFDHLEIDRVVSRIQFTGDIAMCLELLETTNIVVLLPEKLADACKSISAEQKLDVKFPHAPRDIAYWCTKANKDRPQVLHFEEQVKNWLKAHFEM